MDKIIYGGDTETVNGRPNSLQFYSEDIACDTIIFCNEKTAQEKFLKWCGSLKPRVQHVIYLHNLQFDLTELFWNAKARLIENGGEFSFNSHGYTVRGIYGTPTYCSVRKGSSISVHLVDSYSFFRGSLASGAELYCPDLPKLRRPMELGTRRYGAKDGDFIQYAMRDAQVTFHIGKAIEELHNEFDLKQCVSIADMAARVFRHKFLDYTIPQPTDDIVHASLDAYHGGKNNLAVEPGWYPDVHSIDISSAYPAAMREMPAFSNIRLYRAFRGKRTIKRVPDYGVYSVSGKMDDCKWPVLFAHNFKPLRGVFTDTWVQGYELNEALSSGEFTPSRSIRGFIYDAERDHQAPALRNFCDEFYRRKRDEKNKVRRTGYKFILNSISGKFIQSRKRDTGAVWECNNETLTDSSTLIAGGMFHPFIASAITAHTRARIHKLEHHYKALHTATDGIFTRERPAKRGPYRVVTSAQKLGDLTHEARGDLLLVRNKCYILYGKTGVESKAFEGKLISKYALHGFQSSVHTLETLIATGRRRYTVNKPNRLKTALKRGLTPNEFVKSEMQLRIGKLNIHAKTFRG